MELSINERWHLTNHLITNPTILAQLKKRLLWLKVLEVRLSTVLSLKSIGIEHNFSSYEHKTTLQAERIRQIIYKAVRFMAHQKAILLREDLVQYLNQAIKVRTSYGLNSPYTERLAVFDLCQQLIHELEIDIKDQEE